jgi:putative SOS response-associated peptidase YedK
MINARAETVHEKPAFRIAVRCRRCIVPSSGFFEWKSENGRKIPCYVRLKDDSPMYFAGIWDNWKTPDGKIIESFSILTTSSNKLIEPFHARMPVMLHPEEFSLWLDREVTDPEKLKHLYQPYPADLMEMYPVSQLVNSPKTEGPELIKPIIVV